MALVIGRKAGQSVRVGSQEDFTEIMVVSVQGVHAVLDVDGVEHEVRDGDRVDLRGFGAVIMRADDMPEQCRLVFQCPRHIPVTRGELLDTTP